LILQRRQRLVLRVDHVAVCREPPQRAKHPLTAGQLRAPGRRGISRWRENHAVMSDPRIPSTICSTMTTM
jgi:hypothetical protein